MPDKHYVEIQEAMKKWHVLKELSFCSPKPDSELLMVLLFCFWMPKNPLMRKRPRELIRSKGCASSQRRELCCPNPAELSQLKEGTEVRMVVLVLNFAWASFKMQFNNLISASKDSRPCLTHTILKCEKPSRSGIFSNGSHSILVTQARFRTSCGASLLFLNAEESIDKKKCLGD